MTGTKLILILVTAFILVVVGTIWYPIMLKSRIAKNEGQAAGRLKTANGMFATYKKKYSAAGTYPVGNGEGINDGKFGALYYDLNFDEEPIALISMGMAHADCRADGDTDAIEGEDGTLIPREYNRDLDQVRSYPAISFEQGPESGYWFGLMKYKTDLEGAKAEYDLKGAATSYGLVAFPAEYGQSGETTFIMNEEGSIYSMDRGESQYLDTYPGPDPTRENWNIS